MKITKIILIRGVVSFAKDLNHAGGRMTGRIVGTYGLTKLEGSGIGRRNKRVFDGERNLVEK